jgi:hypothetical protein
VKMSKFDQDLLTGVVCVTAVLAFIILMFSGCTAIDDFSAFRQTSAMVVDGGGDGFRVGAVGGDLLAATEDLRLDGGEQTADLSERVDMSSAVKADLLEAADLVPTMDLLVAADLVVLPDLVPCGVCVPGAQRTNACGNCGTVTDTCGMNCQWAAGSCTGQGPCVPNSTQQGGCAACLLQTCGGNCQWSACGAAPGNQCGVSDTTSCRCADGSSGNKPCAGCSGVGLCCWSPHCYAAGSTCD